eukprot:7380804-Prymnesium_polylepis.1
MRRCFSSVSESVSSTCLDAVRQAWCMSEKFDGMLLIVSAINASISYRGCVGFGVADFSTSMKYIPLCTSALRSADMVASFSASMLSNPSTSWLVVLTPDGPASSPWSCDDEGGGEDGGEGGGDGGGDGGRKGESQLYDAASAELGIGMKLCADMRRLCADCAGLSLRTPLVRGMWA